MRNLLFDTQTRASDNYNGRIATEQCLREVLNVVEVAIQPMTDGGSPNSAPKSAPVDGNSSDQMKVLSNVRSHVGDVTNKLASSEKHFQDINIIAKAATSRRESSSARDDSPYGHSGSPPCGHPSSLRGSIAPRGGPPHEISTTMAVRPSLALSLEVCGDNSSPAIPTSPTRGPSRLALRGFPGGGSAFSLRRKSSSGHSHCRYPGRGYIRPQ